MKKSVCIAVALLLLLLTACGGTAHEENILDALQEQGLSFYGDTGQINFSIYSLSGISSIDGLQGLVVRRISPEDDFPEGVAYTLSVRFEGDPRVEGNGNPAPAMVYLDKKCRVMDIIPKRTSIYLEDGYEYAEVEKSMYGFSVGETEKFVAWLEAQGWKLEWLVEDCVTWMDGQSGFVAENTKAGNFTPQQEETHKSEPPAPEPAVIIEAQEEEWTLESAGSFVKNVYQLNPDDFDIYWENWADEAWSFDSAQGNRAILHWSNAVMGGSGGSYVELYDYGPVVLLHKYDGNANHPDDPVAAPERYMVERKTHRLISEIEQIGLQPRRQPNAGQVYTLALLLQQTLEFDWTAHGDTYIAEINAEGLPIINNDFVEIFFYTEYCDNIVYFLDSGFSADYGDIWTSRILSYNIATGEINEETGLDWRDS